MKQRGSWRYWLVTPPLHHEVVGSRIVLLPDPCFGVSSYTNDSTLCGIICRFMNFSVKLILGASKDRLLETWRFVSRDQLLLVFRFTKQLPNG